MCPGGCDAVGILRSLYPVSRGELRGKLRLHLRRTCRRGGPAVRRLRIRYASRGSALAAGEPRRPSDARSVRRGAVPLADHLCGVGGPHQRRHGHGAPGHLHGVRHAYHLRPSAPSAARRRLCRADVRDGRRDAHRHPGRLGRHRAASGGLGLGHCQRLVRDALHHGTPTALWPVGSPHHHRLRHGHRRYCRRSRVAYRRGGRFAARSVGRPRACFRFSRV